MGKARKIGIEFAIAIVIFLGIAIISNIGSNNNGNFANVSGGSFNVHALQSQVSVDSEYGISGWVTNNSSQDAKNVYLIIHWFNKDHAPIGNDRIFIGDIHPGETKDIDGAGLTIPNDYDTDTWDFVAD
jgi:hypothetical protein